MEKILNMVSVSGGKDSTATLLLALEKNVDNLFPVFADTGNEHQITYEYLNYLEKQLGVEIKKVKADFSSQIELKRDRTMEKWRRDGVSDLHIEMVKSLLIPSGNPFLDLCIWKGRFPSTKSQFCTEELKVIPITNEVVWPMLKKYDQIESWQGVRADESERRSKYAMREGIEPDATRVFAYRPIIKWNVEQVFAFHSLYGIKPNPLYSLGMGRVGCMPCINARKDEIRNIAARFPEVIQRISEWEKLVSDVSKRQSSTFFCAVTDPSVKSDDDISFETHGIKRIVDWADTARGGRQRDWIASDAVQSSCSSIYGLCE